jgi:hypothetical protein
MDMVNLWATITSEVYKECVCITSFKPTAVQDRQITIFPTSQMVPATEIQRNLSKLKQSVGLKICSHQYLSQNSAISLFLTLK